MEAEAIEAAKAAAELNIMGGLASVTGVQSPAPTRTAGATAQNNDAAMGAASPIPSAPAAPSGGADNSPQGAVPATPSAVTITTEQLAMLGGIMATAVRTQWVLLEAPPPFPPSVCQSAGMPVGQSANQQSAA